MSQYSAIVMAFGIGAALLAWLGYKFNDSENPIIQQLSIVFVGLSLAMLTVTVASALEIAEALGMTYITNGFTLGALWIMIIANVIYFFTLFVRAMISLFQFMWKYTVDYFGKRKNHGGMP